MGCATSRCQQEPLLVATGSAALNPEDKELVLVEEDDSLDCSAPLPLPPVPTKPPPAIPLAVTPAGCRTNQPHPEHRASEEERLELVTALRRGQLSERFGAFTGLLGNCGAVPLAFISLIDEHEVVSLPCAAPSFSERRGSAVCEWLLSMPYEALLAVDDLASDPRFKDAPCVAGPPHLRAYAAAPLRCSSGTLGALCVADSQPRSFGIEQLELLLRCADMVSQSVEREAEAVRELRSLRQQREREVQQQLLCEASREELHDNLQGSADAVLACDLRQELWPVLACNAAAGALADLLQPIPQDLSFWSLFEVVPGAPDGGRYEQAIDRGERFSLTCRLQFAAERPPECSTSGGQPSTPAARAAALRCRSGPELARHVSANDAVGFAFRRPGTGGPFASQLPSLGEQQQAAVVAGEQQEQADTEGSAAQTVEDLEQRRARARRASLDGALPDLKRKTAPDQVYVVAFSPYTPVGLDGSVGAANGAALPAAAAAAGHPSAWLATICPRNLAATAAQARLGLLIGRHQLQQQHTAARGLSAFASADGPCSPQMAPSRSAAMPQVLLPDSMQGVELGPLLGSGANGRTYAALWHGSRVAVKCVELRDRDPEAQPEYSLQSGSSSATDRGSMALVEAVLAKAMRHPHIVTTHAYGVRETGRHMGTCYNEVMIVQDLCTLGPLLRAIERGRFHREDGQPRVLFVLLTAAEIAGALAYLHSKGVVHGDLSSNNVLLNPSTKDQRQFVALVSDFGLARPLEVMSQLSTDTYGTISYMPPELVLHQKLSPVVDVYSFGVLLWELMSGCRAWAGLSAVQILAAVTTGRRLEVPDSWPRRIKSLIVRCLDPDPRQRPAAKAVYEEIDSMLPSQKD